MTCVRARAHPAAAHREAVVAAVQESCLVPFLARELGQGSFKNMASRAAYYGTLLWVAHALCDPELAPLAAHEPAPRWGTSTGLKAGPEDVRHAASADARAGIRYRVLTSPPPT